MAPSWAKGGARTGHHDLIVPWVDSGAGYGLGRAAPPDNAAMTMDDLRPPADVADIRRFLLAWHGPPTHAPVPDPDPRAPAILREFVALISEWPGVIHQNHLLGADKRWIEDGRLVFYDENQGVVSWAIEMGKEDPPVWISATDRDGPWVREAELLSQFLPSLAMFETCLTRGQASTEPIDRPTLVRVLDDMEQVP